MRKFDENGAPPIFMGGFQQKYHVGPSYLAS